MSSRKETFLQSSPIGVHQLSPLPSLTKMNIWLMLFLGSIQLMITPKEIPCLLVPLLDGLLAESEALDQFTLNGTHYKLVANEGNNTIHGGSRGFSRVVWKVRSHKKEGSVPYIHFSYQSFDGDQEGFPGDLLVSVSYILIGDNRMTVRTKATALNKPTPVNLAQHTHWNLGGHNSNDILSHEIQIFGSHITPVASQHIPTGNIVPVNRISYDFLKSHTIGSRIKKLPDIYDMNYVLDGSAVKQAALLQHKESGRVLKLSTDAPSIQFYMGNGLKDVKGKGGYVYKPHAGLCMDSRVP